jgi:hypothetical protein
MSEYRYFARVNGKMVEAVYMAEPDDPVCDRFLAEGLIESGPAIGCPGDEWYKQKGEANEL